MTISASTHPRAISVNVKSNWIIFPELTKLFTRKTRRSVSNEMYIYIYIHIAPSVDVKSNWIMVREITFPELTKLSYLPGKPEDL